MARRARGPRPGCSSNPERGRCVGPRSGARATSSKPRWPPSSTRSNTRTRCGTDGLPTRRRGNAAREAARREIPDLLRRDVRMLGDVLGRVVAGTGGASLLEDVESLRRLAIRARDSDADERRVERLVASWPVERAEEVARAFT